MNRVSATSSPLIDSDRVEGTNVFDRNGKHIGSIKRLVIEKMSGRVVYGVASFGGFLGMGSKEFTIPWDALTYDVDLSGYLTDITQDQLTRAPDFAHGDEDFSDRRREAALNDFYGSQYYWNE